jgi:SAM-dependent methyltransferase
VNRTLEDIFVDLVRRLDGVNEVCDLGCGSGFLAARLGACGYRVTGIDASADDLEVANRRHATEKISFVRADIGTELMKLLPQGLRFDAVVSSDVIEHLYRPADLLEAAAAMLRPGGHLVVGTPYHGYLKNLAISVLDKWDSHHGVDWDGGHIKFFSVRTLRDLVARHGFREIAIHCHGRLPWLWKHMICVARRGD